MNVFIFSVLLFALISSKLCNRGWGWCLARAGDTFWPGGTSISLQRTTTCSFSQHLEKYWDKDSLKSIRVWIPVCSWVETWHHFMLEESALIFVQLTGIWHCKASGCWEVDKAMARNMRQEMTRQHAKPCNCSDTIQHSKLEQMPAQGKSKSVLSFTFPPAFLLFPYSSALWPCRSESRPFCCVSLYSGWYREGLGVITPRHYSLRAQNHCWNTHRFPRKQGCLSFCSLWFKWFLTVQSNWANRWRKTTHITN